MPETPDERYHIEEWGEDGKNYRLTCEDEHIYIFVGDDGLVKITIPHENRPENLRERLHMDIIAGHLSRLNGYKEEEAQ